MAEAVDAERPIIIGNDHLVKLSNVVDEDGALIDMSSWVLVSWFLRERDDSVTALLTKAATRSGTFNADPDVNTQVWTAALSDTETELLKAGARRYAWKRLDAGEEADLAYGGQAVRLTASR